ncbi:MAG: acyl-CoA synthetase FdrA, partial [Dehalococcoidia bacterium]
QWEGVEQATAMMGTDNNKELLAQVGLLQEEGKAATANDLIVALRLAAPEIEAAALELVQQRLATAGPAGSGSAEYRPRTLEGGLQVLPDANLAIISVPGNYAAAEARKALDHGLHVLLFSDNVSVAEEVDLKRRAIERGLFLLGPDCGTAIIGGVPLGFANAVPAGRVGLVAASGTGLQQATCLLASAGEGVSHALGVGGRDLTDQVGGLMMVEGLATLQEDPNTEIIVLISKPPGPDTQARLHDALRTLPKPCVACFLAPGGATRQEEGVYREATLEDAVRRTLDLLGRPCPDWGKIPKTAWQNLQAASAGVALGPRYIKGLYSGGTLCYEALLRLREMGEEVASNLDSSPGQDLSPDRYPGHLLLDLGEDEYTVGRPHPMIDFRLRCDYLQRATADPQVGVLLLDLVLGYGANPDPASELVPALMEAQQSVRREGRSLACVVGLCGTDSDPQGLARQEEALTNAGAIVVRSNSLAVEIAAALSRGDLAHLQKD